MQMSHVDGPLMVDDPASTHEHAAALSSVLWEELSGQWAWKQSHAKLKNRQQSLCRTRSFKDVYRIIDCNARVSPSQPPRKTNCTVNLKGTPQPSFKGVDSASDMYEQFDSSNNSDVVNEGEETGRMLKMPVSKNFMSERKRRKKINEGLYSLRALMPNISKNFKNQVDEIEEDIADLETHKEGRAVVGAGDEDPRRNNFTVSFQEQIKLEHRIVELQVSQMEERIYLLRIHCKKTPGVLVQLTRAIEALEFEILNANISSVDDHILNSVVVEVKNGLVMKSEELRNMALAVVPKFGFSFL